MITMRAPNSWSTAVNLTTPCFCSKSVQAVEREHWLPRSFFQGRVWPVDHVFPACARCNRTSRVHEMLFALICRLRLSPSAAGLHERAALGEWTKNARGVARVLPEVYRSMHMTVTEKRSRMR